MADLIAQGEKAQQRWRRRLPSGKTVVLGRNCGEFSADWDDRISRRHAEVCWQDGRLHVKRLSSSRNPIFAEGIEQDEFDVRPGEHFVIGQTRFAVTEDSVRVSLHLPPPAHERSFSADFLQQLPFRRAGSRIEVLARLPDVIAGATTDRELFVRVVNLLLTGVPRASAAALVQVIGAESREANDDGRAETPDEVDVLHWDRHATVEGDFEPSERLIRTAIDRGESVLHVWTADGESEFTARENDDWAFCTPVRGEACRGWALYVTGQSDADAATDAAATAPELHDDLKFAEVAAHVLQSLRDVRRLRDRQASLRQFFSPVVLGAIADVDPDVALAPREADVSVLFCDLRGFARESERSAANLPELLSRVSRALGVATRHILEHGGIVGDFHGDSVMGFWGWPIAGDRSTIESACRTALAIRAELERASLQQDSPLTDFQMGVGIATGRAVAGKIGTVDQVKVTAFGPVVNLASRLEGMTKIMHAPILLDETTAAFVTANRESNFGRRRRIAVVRPMGLETPLEVSELLPPDGDAAAAGYVATDADIRQYEAAIDAFRQGRWEEAIDRLRGLPAEDRVGAFLVEYIAKHGPPAPAGWDGVIRLSQK